eukprot:scaffold43790_cov24-Phaeocystis_antarctica.AAC.1
MGREGGVVANVSGLVRSAPPCSTIDPEGEVGLKDDLDEAGRALPPHTLGGTGYLPVDVRDGHHCARSDPPHR